MLERIGFWAYFSQWRFAEALSRLPADAWPCSGLELWACYRLGLYDTVSNASWDGRHLRAGMAMAVSLAACGRQADAEAVLRQLQARHGSGSYLDQLADALAPFMPQQALALVNHDRAPVALRAALLLRCGEREQVTSIIQSALNKPGTVNPELHLFATNALGGSPAEKLARLNAYLAARGLPALALKEADQAPHVGNLRPLLELPAVHGPLVSVLMTTYNTADRISAAIEGLLAQTWRNLEVVVVDDASTDDTQAVVASLAARDARVKYFRLPCNAGTYVAKSIGLELAQGDFITCHDSDDWSHPLRIERQMQPLLADKRLIATTSQWVRVEDDGSYYARPVHPLTRLNPASPLFRRREVEQRTGLWNAVRTGADSEFHSRLKLVFGRRAVRRLVQPLAFGAHRPNSLMTAADTGYTAQGMSPTRLAYWESWTKWHIASLRAGYTPAMPSLRLQALEGGPYEVPQVVEVPPLNILACLEAVREASRATR